MVRFLFAAAAAFLMFLRAAARCLVLAMDFSLCTFCDQEAMRECLRLV